MTIRQEFDGDNGNHRLIDDETGAKTNWVGYSATCYLNGKVGCTGYYMAKEGVYDPDYFCQQMAAGVKE